MSNLPNFLLCGAAKSGTTSIQAMLNAHPEVFMTSPKEPHYFVRDSVQGRVPELVSDKAAYLSLFAGADKARWRGEASVFYLYYFAEAIHEILQLVGREARIAIVLRNPIERAYSAWQHASKYNSDENLDFEAALDAEPDRRDAGNCSPMLYYQDCGLYSKMTSAYLEAFEHSRVFLFDELEDNPESFMLSLFGFLDLEETGQVPATERRNTGGRAWAAGGVGRMVKSLATPSIRRMGKRLAPAAYNRMKLRISDHLMTPVMPMRPETHERLARFFEKDIASLGTLLGRDLSNWLEPGNAPQDKGASNVTR